MWGRRRVYGSSSAWRRPLSSVPVSHPLSDNLNMRAALIHIIGDLCQALGVLIASAFIWWDPKYWWMDPVCSYMFFLLVIVTTAPIVKQSSRILMEATPSGVCPEEVANTLCAIPGVSNVHDLHIWSLGMDGKSLLL